jgi:hypothetical protein
MRVVLDIPSERVEWLRHIEWLADQLPDDVPIVDEGPNDAATLADRLGMSPQWCRDHAAELGGKRRGSGPKAPWRFEWPKARELADALQRKPTSEPSHRKPRPRKKDPEGLLPIRGRP